MVVACTCPWGTSGQIMESGHILSLLWKLSQQEPRTLISNLSLWVHTRFSLCFASFISISSVFLKDSMGKEVTGWAGPVTELLRMPVLKSYVILKLVMVLFRKNRKLSLSQFLVYCTCGFPCAFYTTTAQVLVADGCSWSCSTAWILPNTYWVIYCDIHKRTPTSPIITLENEKNTYSS